MELPAPPGADALPLPPARWLTAQRPAGHDGLIPMLQQLMRQEEAPPTMPRKLLVLDMNGLLVWRARKGQALPREPDATSGQFAIFARPYLRAFLAWCTERFECVVWSTAQRKNLEPMVQLAFDGLPPPLVQLDQGSCTDTGLFDGDRPLMLKDLSRLWSHPHFPSRIG